jgi:hypothetical protein
VKTVDEGAVMEGRTALLESAADAQKTVGEREQCFRLP